MAEKIYQSYLNQLLFKETKEKGGMTAKAFFQNLTLLGSQHISGTVKNGFNPFEPKTCENYGISSATVAHNRLCQKQASKRKKFIRRDCQNFERKQNIKKRLRAKLAKRNNSSKIS